MAVEPYGVRRSRFDQIATGSTLGSGVLAEVNSGSTYTVASGLVDGDTVSVLNTTPRDTGGSATVNAPAGFTFRNPQDGTATATDWPVPAGSMLQFEKRGTVLYPLNTSSEGQFYNDLLSVPVDGQATYTLSAQPTSPLEVAIYVNGQKLRPGRDFTLVTVTLTLTAAYLNNVGIETTDDLEARYVA